MPPSVDDDEIKRWQEILSRETIDSSNQLREEAIRLLRNEQLIDFPIVFFNGKQQEWFSSVFTQEFLDALSRRMEKLEMNTYQIEYILKQLIQVCDCSVRVFVPLFARLFVQDRFIQYIESGLSQQLVRNFVLKAFTTCSDLIRGTKWMNSSFLLRALVSIPSIHSMIVNLITEKLEDYKQLDLQSLASVLTLVNIFPVTEKYCRFPLMLSILTESQFVVIKIICFRIISDSLDLMEKVSDNNDNAIQLYTEICKYGISEDILLRRQAYSTISSLLHRVLTNNYEYNCDNILIHIEPILSTMSSCQPPEYEVNKMFLLLLSNYLSVKCKQYNDMSNSERKNLEDMVYPIVNNTKTQQLGSNHIIAILSPLLQHKSEITELFLFGVEYLLTTLLRAIISSNVETEIIAWGIVELSIIRLQCALLNENFTIDKFTQSIRNKLHYICDSFIIHRDGSIPDNILDEGFNLIYCVIEKRYWEDVLLRKYETLGDLITRFILAVEYHSEPDLEGRSDCKSLALLLIQTNYSQKNQTKPYSLDMSTLLRSIAIDAIEMSPDKLFRLLVLQLIYISNEREYLYSFLDMLVDTLLPLFFGEMDVLRICDRYCALLFFMDVIQDLKEHSDKVPSYFSDCKNLLFQQIEHLEEHLDVQHLLEKFYRMK
jgi:hypothetical protein